MRFSLQSKALENQCYYQPITSNSVVNSTELHLSDVSKKIKETKSDAKEEFEFWLMKSEPESRFENGIDVKVCL